MNYLSYFTKKAYQKGNYKIRSEDSGWISPSGEVYFIEDHVKEHSDLLLEIHDAGDYSPSDSAFRKITENREESDYTDNSGGISVDYFMAMAQYDGWIRFFGGEDDRWAGLQGNIVNFECYDSEILKKLHRYLKQDKVRVDCPEIFVEVESINYGFNGSVEQFIENGLDIRLHKIIASRKKKADVGDYWYIFGKLYDASEEGHAQIIQKYLEDDPDIDPEELENMYNSNQHFRDYALNKLDGIRIAQDQVEVGSLNAEKMNQIRKAFIRIYDEEAYSMKIGIQDNKTKTYYFNIPFNDIDGDAMKKLRRYKMYGAKYLGVLVKKADFSGDFQNIYDIRPDPGNAYPGRNREYVKQQTDYFPHKVSVEDDEFVHTHPEHCPRPDLRKLKVVDDPDESESEFSKPEADK